VMHRGMAVVAHGEIDQAEGGGHSAHQAHSHSIPDTTSAQAMRVGALIASRAVPGETGSCMRHFVIILPHASPPSANRPLTVS
jgi:hypothetical protein